MGELLFVQDATLDEPPTKKPTRLAIGLEGGFSGGVEKVRKRGFRPKITFAVTHHSSIILSDYEL